MNKKFFLIFSLKVNFRYFLCGGLFFSRKKISKSAFIYDSRNNSAEKLKKMKSYRYTTNIILKNNYIFVLGGRAYGEDQSGILKTCEKFNLNTMKWESMADMNTPRCTGMVFLLEGLIYIAGGYRGSSFYFLTFILFYFNFIVLYLNLLARKL